LPLQRRLAVEVEFALFSVACCSSRVARDSATCAWYWSGSIWNSSCPFSTSAPSANRTSLRNPGTRATRSTVREAEACPVKSAASWIGATSGLLTVTGGGGGATKAGLRLQADRPAPSTTADSDTSAARITQCRTPPSADIYRVIARTRRATPYAKFLKKLEANPLQLERTALSPLTSSAR